MIAGSPTLEAMSSGLLSWLLTYFVHSSVLLGLACLLWRWLPATSLPAKEFLLKIGLVGGLLTASLQIGLGLQPLTATWELPGDSRSASRDVSLPHASATDSVALHGLQSAESVSSRPKPSAATASWEERLAILEETLPPLRLWLSLAWLLGAAVLTGALLISYLRLFALLRDRTWLEKGPVHQLLQRLIRLTGARRRIGLSSSRRIGVPMARGVLRGEICLPHGALGEHSTQHHEIGGRRIVRIVSAPLG